MFEFGIVVDMTYVLSRKIYYQMKKFNSRIRIRIPYKVECCSKTAAGPEPSRVLKSPICSPIGSFSLVFPIVTFRLAVKSDVIRWRVYLFKMGISPTPLVFPTYTFIGKHDFFHNYEMKESFMPRIVHCLMARQNLST